VDGDEDICFKGVCMVLANADKEATPMPTKRSAAGIFHMIGGASASTGKFDFDFLVSRYVFYFV
jgi:hypothetical protein